MRRHISATWRPFYWWVIWLLGISEYVLPHFHSLKRFKGLLLWCWALHIWKMEACWLPLTLCSLSQPMKPLKAAATTSQPVLTLQQIETIFFKVPELHEIHKDFYDGLLPRVQEWSHCQCVGDLFQKLVSNVLRNKTWHCTRSILAGDYDFLLPINQ